MVVLSTLHTVRGARNRECVFNLDIAFGFTSKCANAKQI